MGGRLEANGGRKVSSIAKGKETYGVTLVRKMLGGFRAPLDQEFGRKAVGCGDSY